MNQIFLIFCLASFFNFYSSSELIALKPNDPVVFLGECLILNCSLSSLQYGNSSTLYITFKGKSFSDHHYEIIDENTMKFNTCISDLDESGTYFCKKKITNVSNQTELRFNGQVVRVEKALVPIPKDSIKCLVMNWRIMNCTWSLGQTYKDPNEIQVDLTFKIIKTYAPTECPKLLQTSCQWMRTDADLTMPFLINLTVSHKRRPEDKIVTAVQLPRKKTVKPSPVKLIEDSIFTNNSCFGIKWTHNYSYKVTYNVTLDSKDEVKRTIPSKKKYLEICNLLPHEKYKVGISAFPKRDPGIWSDPLFLDVLTNGTHPSQPPSVNSSSFLWNMDHSGFILYWQSLTRKQSGAENVWYLIHVENQITPAFSGKTVIKLPLHKQVKKCWLLQIWAENSFGRSKRSSNIEICNDASVPDASKMVEILILNDTYVEVMWRKPSLEKAFVSQFKVLACRNCSVDLQWWVIDANKSSVVLQLDDPETYSFGVAAENQNGSSGLTWGYCYYYRNKPRTPIAGFSVEPIYNKLQVDWKPYNCLEEKTFIIEYQVKYCVALNNSRCKERVKVRSVPRSQTKFQTSELLPNDYLVWVEPVTYAGSGPSSIKRVVQIPNSSLSTAVIAGITVAAIFLFTFIFLGCIFIYKNCASQIAECDPKIDFPKISVDEHSRRIFSNSNSSSTSDPDSPTCSSHTDITHLSTNSHCNSSMCNGLGMDPDLQGSHTYMKIGLDSKESYEKSNQSSPTFSLQFTRQQNANNNAVFPKDDYVDPNASDNNAVFPKDDYVDPIASDNSFDPSRSSKNSHDNILDDNISFSDSNSVFSFNSILGKVIGSQTTGDDVWADKLPDVKHVQENNQNCVPNNLEAADRNIILTKRDLGVGYSDSKVASENISQFQNPSLQFIPNQHAKDDCKETSSFSNLSDQSASSRDSHDQLLDDNDSSFSTSNSSFGFNNDNFNMALDATDNNVSNITGFCDEELMVPNLEDDSQKRGVCKDEQIVKILSPTETSLEMSFLTNESDKGSPKIKMNGLFLKNNISSTKEQMLVNLPNNKSGNNFITDKSDNDTYVYVDDMQNDDDDDDFSLNGHCVKKAQVKQIDAVNIGGNHSYELYELSQKV